MKKSIKGSLVILAGMFLCMIPVILGDPLEAVTNLLSILGVIYIMTGLSIREKTNKNKSTINS